MPTSRTPVGRSSAARRTGATRTRWRIVLVLATVTLAAVLAALHAEGFAREARLLHAAGWSLLALLGVSDGLRRFHGASSALGDGQSALDRGLGLVQAGLCVAMLLGILPLPR